MCILAASDNNDSAELAWVWQAFGSVAPSVLILDNGVGSGDR